MPVTTKRRRPATAPAPVDDEGEIAELTQRSADEAPAPGSQPSADERAHCDPPAGPVAAIAGAAAGAVVAIAALSIAKNKMDQRKLKKAQDVAAKRDIDRVLEDTLTEV